MNPPMPPPSKHTWKLANIFANLAPKNPAIAPCRRRRPTIAVNWREHDFGRIRKGTPLPVYDLIISSTGTADLASIKVALNGNQFQIENAGDIAKTLAPGKTTTVKIKFQPKTYGLKNAKIRITSNAANESAITVRVKGKQYSVITFIVEEEPTGAKVDDVKLKVRQAGQKEQEITTMQGKVELETEREGDFEIMLGRYQTFLEFRSLTTA